MADDSIAPGEVWLVGAGPGDPELLTRKAERLLRAASVVFYDALVGPGVLALIPEQLRKVAVGKRAGRHSRSQEAINALLVEAALAGERVVRLKGGDPSIFGRWGEELAYLAAAGIRASVCPGITAASAAAADARISLSVRGIARSITFVTAHAPAGNILDLDWSALAQPAATLAIYMGRSSAAEVSQRLIQAGRSPDTPVLVAVNVSTGDERLIRGRLSALAFLVRTISDDDPAVILIGEAVDGLRPAAMPPHASPRALLERNRQ